MEDTAVREGSALLRPKALWIDPASTHCTRALAGPPETVTMRAGAVVLEPEAAIGKHCTDKYEEMLVVLSGTGEMRLADGTVLALRPHSVAYCPPRTEHDVANTGSEALRYIYVVALAERGSGAAGQAGLRSAHR